MSLVYDALRQPATAAAVVGRLPPQAATPWSQVLGRHRPVLWLLCGVLVAGPVGFLVSHQLDAPVPADRHATTPAQAAPTGVAQQEALPLAVDNASAAVATLAPTTAQAATPPLAVTDARVQASIPTTLPFPASASALAPALETEPAQPAAPVAIASTTSPAPPAVAPAHAPTAHAPFADASASQAEVKVVASQIQLSVRKADTASEARAGAGEVDPATVRTAMAELNTAVGEHDALATAAALARLQSLLPAGSLTLLRARAWAAHGNGNHTQAEQLYRAILERVPEDEHAGVNLALLDARRGEMAEARARLDRMAARNSRSPQILQALAELDADRR
jgi:tetratricopeptide (TPR) repeat protein